MTTTATTAKSTATKAPRTRKAAAPAPAAPVVTVAKPAKAAPVAKAAPRGLDAEQAAEYIHAAYAVAVALPKAEQARVNVDGVALRGSATGVFAAFGRGVEGQWFFAAVDSTGTVHGQGSAATRTLAKSAAMKTRSAVVAAARTKVEVTAK